MEPTVSAVQAAAAAVPLAYGLGILSGLFLALIIRRALDR